MVSSQRNVLYLALRLSQWSTRRFLLTSESTCATCQIDSVFGRSLPGRVPMQRHRTSTRSPSCLATGMLPLLYRYSVSPNCALVGCPSNGGHSHHRCQGLQPKKSVHCTKKWLMKKNNSKRFCRYQNLVHHRESLCSHREFWDLGSGLSSS